MTNKNRIPWWLPMVLAAVAIVVAVLVGTPAEWLRFAGRLHPMLVHFPIALILTAGLFESFSIYRSSPQAAQIARACLTLGALSALVAVGSGWIHAEQESQSRSMADTLFWHRWTGVSVAVLALASLAAAHTRWTRLHRGGLFAACLLVGLGGHLGGEMVYGEGYLTEVFRSRSSPESAPSGELAPPPPEGETPAGEQGFSPDAISSAPPDPEPAAAPPADNGGTFPSKVAPILRSRCISCHGPAKKKGNLRLDRREFLFGPDPEAWVVVPGEPEQSELLRLVSLPEDDLDRMPGKGDALSPEQIEVLRRWIETGAPWPAEFVIEAEPEPEGL